MKLQRVVGLIFVILGLLAGCEPQEEDQPVDAAWYASPDTFQQCSTNRLNYYFVRLSDWNTSSSPGRTGASIDAVSLSKDNFDRVIYATKVIEYSPENAEKISDVARISEHILGEPDAFGTPFDRQNAGPDKTCSLDEENYLSLGIGGSVVLSFGDEKIEEGDVITVYEIGNCNGLGVADPVTIWVALSGNDSTWYGVPLITETSPVISGQVKYLPVLTPNGLPPCP